MLIDLHTHTRPRSPCSMISPLELARGAQRAGLDAICLTEHDQIWTTDELGDLARRHEVLILRGMEVTTGRGHMLVFGLDDYVSGIYNAEVLRRVVDEVRGYMILAHPWRSGISGGPALEIVDAVEILNGSNLEAENTLAQDLCARYELPGVGGSDTHYLRDIGSCATLFERTVFDERSLIDELKAGRFQAVNLRTAGADRGR